MKKFAILGSGPAGLMAAHALRMRIDDGYYFKIISLGDKSPLYGAQYLHAPIDGFTPSRGVKIDYALFGSTESYRRKVYGEGWDGTVSPEDLSSEHWGWDLRATYDALWDEYERYVEVTKVDHSIVNGLLNDGYYVISSVPADRLCALGHMFRAQDILAAGDAPDLGILIPYNNIPENTVWCNGDPDGPSWYRLSNIYGHKTVEYPTGTPVPLPGTVSVIKPLDHNCNCYVHPNFLRIGRYGKWQKGVLTHHAYQDVLDWAEKINNG